MATSPAPPPNWLTRLKNLPRRWWIAFFAISLVAHVIGVGTVLVLLFGGQRGGDNVAESLIISAAADNQEGVDLELPDMVILNPTPRPRWICRKSSKCPWKRISTRS